MELLNIKDLNISFTQYDKGMRQTELNVIRSLDVTVNAGEMVAVVGSSGSGKSLLAPVSKSGMHGEDALFEVYNAI